MIRVMVHVDLMGADLAMFEAYEDVVLPLVADHGGAVEQRLRSLDNALEVHVMAFPDDAAFQAFLADPKRAEHARMWVASRASATLIQVEAV